MRRTLTGTSVLLRFFLRRDRLRLPVWIASVTAFVLFSGLGVREAYPTQSELDARARLIEGNPAMVALTGPAHGYDEPTLGRIVANELGLYGMVGAAAMSIFLLVRHTRADEEDERAELVRSGVVGRDAPLAAALLLVTGGNLVVGMMSAGALTAVGLDAGGALVLGASFAAVGITFGGVAAIAAQVTGYARGATSIAVGVLGVAFVVRAVGDVGNGVVSWLSPIGWGQASRPFAGDEWWPLLLAVAAGAIAACGAFALSGRRDLGAGLVAQRPGPPGAAAGLSHPVGFAFRLQRAALGGWIVGMALFGAVYGSVGRDVESFLEDNPDLAEMFAVAGADLTDSFFASIVVLFALCVGGCGIQLVVRLRTEEAGGRAEPMLATPLSRSRWVSGPLVLATAGTAAALAAGGSALGLVYGVTVGDLGETARLTVAALAHLPAVLVLVGFTVALFGIAPRLLGVAWATLAFAFVAWLGAMFGLPDWFEMLSPFGHTPDVPAAELAVAPLAVLLAIAAALTGAGYLGIRRRDMAT